MPDTATIQAPPLTPELMRELSTRFTSALIHEGDMDCWVVLRYHVVTRQTFIHDPSRARKPEPKDGVYLGRFVRPCHAHVFRDALLEALGRVRPPRRRKPNDTAATVAPLAPRSPRVLQLQLFPSEEMAEAA